MIRYDMPIRGAPNIRKPENGGDSPMPCKVCKVQFLSLGPRGLATLCAGG